MKYYIFGSEVVDSYEDLGIKELIKMIKKDAFTMGGR